MDKRKTQQTLLALVLATGALTTKVALADSLDQLELLSQDEFKTLSENVAAATHYKSISPAEPLGALGFDVALELSSTEIDSDLFDQASAGGFDLGSFLVPRLHVHKGLPFKLDIGASLTAIPDTDFKVIGAEIRYAILEGTIATPALAIRLTHSKVTGLDELDMDSTGAEITISKGFAMLTPYAGAGTVRTNSDPNVGTLLDESFSQRKLYAGVNFNLGVNIGLEVDVTGDYTTYSAKVGLRF